MVKYIPNGNTKVVIDRTTYQNDGEKYAILPVDKLGEDEIERLLKRKLIKKLELNEAAVPASAGDDAKPKNKPDKNKPDKNKPPVAKPREELLREAAEAGLTVTDETTDEEIQKLIAEAKGDKV